MTLHRPRSTVWVVQNTGHDFSVASDRGEVVFLYDDDKINVFSIDRMTTDIRERLINSSSDDYFIPAGSSVAVCVAFACLMAKHGAVNVLIWSFREEMYEVRTIGIKQLLGLRGEEEGAWQSHQQ